MPVNSPVPVSVVIPCFRCLDTIERAIASILAQTRRPAEVILVDDASGDGTRQLVSRLIGAYEGPIRFKLVALDRNVGPSAARNAGWDASGEPFVAFLDADDTWHPRKLEVQYGYMAGHPGVSVSGHLHVVSVEGIAAREISDAPAVRGIGFPELLWRNRFTTTSAMLRRELSFRFNPDQRHMEDHRLWLEIAHAGHRVVRLEETYAAHHKHDYGAGGLSGDLWAMERGELRNYSDLWRSGAISLVRLLSLAVWSLAKFVRRAAIVGLRKARSRLQD